MRQARNVNVRCEGGKVVIWRRCSWWGGHLPWRHRTGTWRGSHRADRVTAELAVHTRRQEVRRCGMALGMGRTCDLPPSATTTRTTHRARWYTAMQTDYREESPAETRPTRMAPVNVRQLCATMSTVLGVRHAGSLVAATLTSLADQCIAARTEQGQCGQPDGGAQGHSTEHSPGTTLLGGSSDPLFYVPVALGMRQKRNQRGRQIRVWQCDARAVKGLPLGVSCPHACTQSVHRALQLCAVSLCKK